MRAKKVAGFSLVEVAIVLIVIAALGGGAIAALRVNQMRANYSATRAALDEAKEAVLYFAVVHKRLPCPAKSVADGSEDLNASNKCAKRRGLLAWEALGIQAQDGWSNRLSYVVTDKLASEPISMFEKGDIAVKVRDDAGAVKNLLSEAAVVFAIWSHGMNGRHAASSQGGDVADDSTTNSDEDDNRHTLANGTVFARDASDNSATPGGEFDDIVVWGSRYVMVGRLLSAGQLP